jgi:hypothetical protein
MAWGTAVVSAGRAMASGDRGMAVPAGGGPAPLAGLAAAAVIAVLPAEAATRNRPARALRSE